MDWFKRLHPYLPERCPNGHELGPGKVSTSFVPCDCDAVTDGRGHHIVHCRVIGCRSSYGPGGCLGRKDPR